MEGNQSSKVVEDTLLRPRDLAAEFNISVGYLSHLRQVGEGPEFVRFGRAYPVSRVQRPRVLIAAHECRYIQRTDLPPPQGMCFGSPLRARGPGSLLSAIQRASLCSSPRRAGGQSHLSANCAVRKGQNRTLDRADDM